MRIAEAEPSDLPAILELQYLAYQSEAELLGRWDIQPLRQSLAELAAESRLGYVRFKESEQADQLRLVGLAKEPRP